MEFVDLSRGNEFQGKRKFVCAHLVNCSAVSDDDEAAAKAMPKALFGYRLQKDTGGHRDFKQNLNLRSRRKYTVSIN